MGRYINPPDESKEDFLNREAVEISREEFISLNFPDEEMAHLCLVKNASFSACVVSESKEDSKYYADLSDERPKRYFLIEHSKIKELIND